MVRIWLSYRRVGRTIPVFELFAMAMLRLIEHSWSKIALYGLVAVRQMIDSA